MNSIDRTRAYLERLLRVSPDAKPGVYIQMYEASDSASLNYWIELVLSAGIATLGLVLNSPAVVIGAMLVSPLMGPILSAGLALAAADFYLGVRSLLTLTLSIVAAISFSGFVVWLLPFQSPTSEILARTQPNLLDLGVALFSGLAGSLLTARGGGGGGVTALPGVSIAVALMPPLCTVGFGVGAGFNLEIMGGAGLLFVTNLVAIVGSAFLVFFVLRMDAPEVRANLSQSIDLRRRDRLYAWLQNTALGGALPSIGKLQWRVLMLVAALGILFVPLVTSLLKLKEEVTSREAVRTAIRSVVPRSAIVSEQVDLGQKVIQIALVVTEPAERERVARAEQSIIQATGKRAKLTVRRVASDEELSALRERLKTPALARATEIEMVRSEIAGRMQSALGEIWPSESAELKSYELAFGAESVTARLSYEARQPLETASQEMIRNLLRTRLGAPALETAFVHLQKETKTLPAKVARRR